MLQKQFYIERSEEEEEEGAGLERGEGKKSGPALSG